MACRAASEVIFHFRFVQLEAMMCGRAVCVGGCFLGQQRANLGNLSKLATREQVGEHVVFGRYPMYRECDVMQGS
jgi:hypothetical protein